VGEALADIVWDFEKKFGMDRSTLAVVMSFVSNEAQLKESHVPGVIANYYTCYKTKARAPGNKGQESSLVSLPLFSLNPDTAGDILEELGPATSRFELLWHKLTDLLFSWAETRLPDSKELRYPLSDPEGKKLLWLKAVDWLRLDLNNVKPIERSPASEKVRSVMMHLVHESVFNKNVLTAEQLKIDFDERCRSLWDQVSNGLAPKTKSRRGKSLPPADPVANVEVTKALLKRFRYVPFVDSGWIQGCEVNAVVALVYKRYTFFTLSPALSRAKLLAIALMPTKDREETKRTWQGPWQDWKEEMKIV
jgi:hypothetical protein